jgi:hypothetical protein
MIAPDPSLQEAMLLTRGHHSLVRPWITLPIPSV